MPPGAATERLYLIDAHSLIFQVFHATARAGPAMTSPSGLPTNALHGFTRDLLYLRGLKPDYLVCACDLSGPTFRSDLFAEYKAHRAPMPNDLELQIPHIWRIVAAFDVPLLSHPRLRSRRRDRDGFGSRRRPRAGRAPLHRRQGLPAAPR